VGSFNITRLRYALVRHILLL